MRTTKFATRSVRIALALLVPVMIFEASLLTVLWHFTGTPLRPHRWLLAIPWALAALSVALHMARSFACIREVS